MGPVQSFKSSYDNKISKRKKPKRKQFGASHLSTVEGTIPTKQMSEALKKEILISSKQENRRIRIKLVILYTIIIVILCTVLIKVL